MKQPHKILVIRLGALGDFIQSFYPFAAIRHAHPLAEITLLTTENFMDIGQKSPWFDRVMLDKKPSWLNLSALWVLRKKLREFDYIYDLQTSRRSTRYLRLAGWLQGSGIAVGLSHVHDNPDRNSMHTLDRQKDQLQKAGIREFPFPELDWFIDGWNQIVIDRPYAVLVPGCSARHPVKRWPIENYAEIAKTCLQKGIVPVVVGGKEETSLAERFLQICPEGINLVGKTNLFQLGNLMKDAQFVLGNDTGPMHIASIVGCSCYVLFSSASDPALTAPRGNRVHVVMQKDLRELTVKKVAQELNWVH